mgnify:CR=1 FL=1
MLIYITLFNYKPRISTKFYKRPIIFGKFGTNLHMFLKISKKELNVPNMSQKMGLKKKKKKKKKKKQKQKQQ